MTHHRNAPRLTDLDLMMLSRFGQSHSEKVAAAESALAGMQDTSKLRLWIADLLRSLAQSVDGRTMPARTLAESLPRSA